MRASVSELLGEVHRRFAAAPLSYGHGTDNAWDEAVALVVGVTGLPDAEASLKLRLPAGQAAAIRHLADRRVEERRPLAYLLGKVPYCGEPFHVPEGIVVPRSPIGPLLMDGRHPWLARIRHQLPAADADSLALHGRAPSSRFDVLSSTPASSSGPRDQAGRRLDALATKVGDGCGLGGQRLHEPERILDLCCGSGCLGILAAKRFPNARVVLADIDPLAVSTARRNVALHGLEGRVETVRSDLFSGLRDGLPARANPPIDAGGVGAEVPPQSVCGTAQVAGRSAPGPSDPEGEFDLILCNPPYVDADAMRNLPPEFVCEPTLGLHGGSDGLALMNRVIGEVTGFLTGDGVLVGEVGEAAGRLEARWPGIPFFWPDLPAGGTGVFLLHAAHAP